VNHGSKIAAIVEDQVWVLTIGEGIEGLFYAPDILLLGLTLPGEDRDASGSNRGSSMVLSGEDVLKIGRRVRPCKRITSSCRNSRKKTK
jgi:hypothetical protein